MAKTRAQKEKQVVILADKVKASKSVVFVDFKGLKMSQLAELRDQLSEQDAQLLVTKNTLLDLALKEAELIATDSTSGPTATLFSREDEISPIKTLVKALKNAQTGSIKGGFLGHQFIDSFTVTKLAGLPGKQELRGQVVGMLASPLQGMVGVLQANLRNFVYALDQIRIMKGGE